MDYTRRSGDLRRGQRVLQVRPAVRVCVCVCVCGGVLFCTVLYCTVLYYCVGVGVHLSIYNYLFVRYLLVLIVLIYTSTCIFYLCTYSTQVAFGSGFKCNSAVWLCMNNPEHGEERWEQLYVLCAVNVLYWYSTDTDRILYNLIVYINITEFI
jgi:hypothetical protein